MQLPVSSSQLTVTRTTTTSIAAPVAANPATPAGGTLDAALYVDSVNGTGPAAAAPRPVGCTQTNVFKRGEQFVLRTWGSDMATGNIPTRTSTRPPSRCPASPQRSRSTGARTGRRSNRVWFWTNAWNIPTGFPLGDVTIRVTFKLDSGKVGAYDYAITIIP